MNKWYIIIAVVIVVIIISLVALYLWKRNSKEENLGFDKPFIDIDPPPRAPQPVNPVEITQQWPPQAKDPAFLSK
jgi:flagellar basal body-associated protein FliL